MRKPGTSGWRGWAARSAPIVSCIALATAAALSVPVPANAQDQTPSAAPVMPKNQPQRGLVYDGLEKAPASTCKDTLRLKGSDRCTHGPDEAPAGVDIHKSVAPLAATPASAAGTTDLTPQVVQCDGDGASGKRTQVIYARSSDVTDRYSTFLASIRTWAEGADAIYDASAAETGGSRHIRFVHDASCNVTVANVVMNATGDDNFTNTINELSRLGYNRTDRKYMIFADATVYCGIGNLAGDDQPGPANASNGGPSYGRSDSGCWNAGTAAHEHMHNLGGVQASAPHTSGGGHCVDEYDLMCYSDSPNFPKMQILCPATTHDQRFDCNHDDYYNTSPAGGSYLSNHWNVTDSQYLTGGSAWGGWESLGGVGTSSPAVSSWANGRLDVFVRGTDNALHHKWYSGGFSGWESLGGGLTSSPAAVSWSNGRIDVFARGGDNALWHKWFDGGWSGWESLGGTLTSAPTVSSWGPGRLDVFARSTDNAIWHKWFDGGWSGWESLGGGLTSAPAAVSWGSGRIDLVARGGDNALWHKWYEGGWSGWESLGGGLTSDPGISSWGVGRLDIFARGGDNALWRRWYENGWADWSSLGGGLTSGPAAVSWGPRRIDVFALGGDSAVWHNWYG